MANLLHRWRLNDESRSGVSQVGPGSFKRHAKSDLTFILCRGHPSNFRNFVGFPHNRYFWKILCRFAASQYFFENNFTNVLKLLWFHFGPFRLQTEQCHVVFLKKITGIWGQFTKNRNMRVFRFYAKSVDIRNFDRNFYQYLGINNKQ